MIVTVWVVKDAIHNEYMGYKYESQGWGRWEKKVRYWSADIKRANRYHNAQDAKVGACYARRAMDRHPNHQNKRYLLIVKIERSMSAEICDSSQYNVVDVTPYKTEDEAFFNK